MCLSPSGDFLLSLTLRFIAPAIGFLLLLHHPPPFLDDHFEIELHFPSVVIRAGPSRPAGLFALSLTGLLSECGSLFTFGFLDDGGSLPRVGFLAACGSLGFFGFLKPHGSLPNLGFLAYDGSLPDPQCTLARLLT